MLTKNHRRKDLGVIFCVPGCGWNFVGIFGVPGFSFFPFQLEFWVCICLVAGRIPVALVFQNELYQDKFGRWTTFDSNTCYQKWFLI